MRRPRPHKFIEVWVLFYLWLRRASPLLFVLIPHLLACPPLVVGTLLGKSCDLAAVSVYHQGHRRVYRPGSYGQFRWIVLLTGS